jgi:DNA primase
MAKTLVQVMEEQGLDLKDSSDGRKVLHCIFHTGDHKESLTVYPTGTYFCFACSAWGDAVKFLVDYKNYSAKDALEYVGEDYKAPKRNKTQVIKIQNGQNTWKFLYDVAESYHQFLLETPGAINYLHSRGFTDETIKKYKLGYTDGAVLKLFYAWEMDIGIKMGVVTANGYELLSHRIVIPNLLENSYCDFLVGRTVVNDRTKYLNTHGSKPLIGFYEVRNSPILFIAEGQLDYLTLRQWGWAAAVLGGTHITKAQRLLLANKKLVILPDFDPSGIGLKTAKSLAESFKPNAVILDYSDLNPSPTEKLDINTLATVEGAENAFKDLVLKRVEWICNLSQRQQNLWFPALGK